MRLLAILFSCIILFQINVFAELTSSSCALLRTGISLTTIVPEIAQLGMRYYSASTSQSRQKRFLRDTTPAKNGSTPNIKGTVVEQMMANTIRDVNFTNVALLLLNNSDSLQKLRTHVDQDAILRLIVRGVDYEKLITGFMSAAESEFDLEHFIASILNKTRINAIHDEILTNGTLPEWFIKSIHPNLTAQTVKRIFSTLKNVSEKFVKVLSKSERFDNYLFNMLIQQALTPLSNILQNVKDEKPKTFDQLIKIIVNNVNKVAQVNKY